MAAYWVGFIRVTNEAAYGEYAKLAGPAVQKYGGRFLARGGRSITLEGADYPRRVVVEFPSVEQAQKCYDSPEYAKALAFAKSAAERLLAIVEGV